MNHSEKIQIRIDPELLARLRREAAARGLGMSALVRWALLSFFGESKESRLVDTRTGYEVQRD